MSRNIIRNKRILNSAELSLSEVFTPAESAPLFFANAATTNVLQASTYNNGAGTLTGNVNGALNAQDGITLIATNILLVKNQASGLQNGLYELTTVGDASNPFVLTRLTTYNETAEIYPSQINVLAGNTNGLKYYLQSTVDPIIGTSSIVYSSIPAPNSPVYPLKFIDVHTETVLPNTPTYSSGADSSSPGYNAIYTSSSNAVFPTLQGVAPYQGLKILVKDQVDATKNGDYVLLQIGVAGGSGSPWIIRRVSFNSGNLYQHAWLVYQGTSKGLIFNQTTSNLVTANIGTSGNITFVKITSSSTPNVQTVTSAATVTPTASNDEIVVTALAAACQFLNPTGTYTQGQAYFISIKDDSTSRAITWDTKFKGYGAALFSATTLGKRSLIPVIYDSVGDTHMVLPAQTEQ